MENTHRKRTLVVSFADNIYKDAVEEILQKRHGLAIIRWIGDKMAKIAVPEGKELYWREALKKLSIVRAVTLDEHL